VLSKLAEMDENMDGIITLEEWSNWFGQVCSALSKEELDDVLSDMTLAGDSIVTTIKCTRLANEAADDAAATAAQRQGDEDEEGSDAPLPHPNQDERLKRVNELFELWDFEDSGSISRDAVEASALKIGPHKANVLSFLSNMDADGDGRVTREEMTSFFTQAGQSLDDASFDEIFNEMKEVAEHAGAVARCLSFTKVGEAKQEGGSTNHSKINPTVGEETEAEADGRTSTAPLPDPELPAEVVPAVDELFAIYVKPGEDVIFLSNISGGSTLQPNLRIGPSSFKPFEALLPMDLDGDGKVELSEMRSFFAHSGMGAEELKATLDEMISQATAAKLAQSLN